MERHRVSVVLFEGFELLDVFGPVELFSAAPQLFALEFLGPAPLVASSQGIEVTTTHRYDSADAADIVLVPGGRGTRPLAQDAAFLGWLGEYAASAAFVTSVCTGSALLAASGLLDGYRATSNKRAFDWVAAQGERVDWVRQARWVEDRNRWTSSGVAAGMDMTAAFIAHLHGADVARSLTDYVELDVHPDATRDPFAAVTSPTPRQLGL